MRSSTELGPGSFTSIPGGSSTGKHPFLSIGHFRAFSVSESSTYVCPGGYSGLGMVIDDIPGLTIHWPRLLHFISFGFVYLYLRAMSCAPHSVCATYPKYSVSVWPSPSAIHRLWIMIWTRRGFAKLIMIPALMLISSETITLSSSRPSPSFVQMRHQIRSIGPAEAGCPNPEDSFSILKLAAPISIAHIGRVYHHYESIHMQCRQLNAFLGKYGGLATHTSRPGSR